MKTSVTLESIVKGFANKHRISILTLLNKDPYLDVDSISVRLSVGYKTTAVHLQRMYDAGLVEKEDEGSFVLHSLTARGRQILNFLKKVN